MNARVGDLAGRGPLGLKEPKAKPIPAYLAKVRALPCCICEAFGEMQHTPTTAHHVIHGRFSQRKVPDRMTIPLCADHHQLGGNGKTEHLFHATLVHLVRHGRRTGNQNLVSLVLPVLLSRCEANLLLNVPDGQMPDAASLREEILCSFSELFASDGSGDNPNELNFFECRFNRAFKFFRIDMVRREIARLQPITQMPPPDDDGEPGPHDEVFARVSEAFRTVPTQEGDLVLSELHDAIVRLPADERDAVILVHMLGYKEESDESGSSDGSDPLQLLRTHHSQPINAGGRKARPVQGGSMNPIHTASPPGLRDALYTLATAKAVPDAALLDDLVRRYPQFSSELTDYAIAIAIDALRWRVGEAVTSGPLMQHPDYTRFLREDGPTITAYREALRLMGVDPDSIAKEATK